MNKPGRGRKRRAEEIEDYRGYRLSFRELSVNVAVYLLLDLTVSYLFYESLTAVFLFLPGLLFFLKERKKALARRRSREMQAQFLTGIQLINTSLQAGYSVENSLREAVKELGKIYRPGDFILKEFRYMDTQIRVNRTIEALLSDLGRRSGEEVIRNFAEIFQTAKRTGGDIPAIIRNTVSGIRQRQETRLEIETSLAGRVMEQRIMSMIPLLILLYVRLTSPGFLDPLYHNTAGITVMSVCLAVYLTAFLWGKKIMTIEV